MSVLRASIATLATLLIVVSHAAAQDTTRVTAHLESDRIPLGETVDLVITIEPEGMRTSVEEPILPDLPATVVGRSRASQVTMSGTRVQRTILHRVRLRPSRPGPLTIPPIRVVVGGRTVATSPLVLDVVDRGDARLGLGESPADGGPPPFFVNARVDRDRARVGEQVTLTFSFYHDPRVPMAESPDYDPPETPGFWRIELSDEPHLSTERLGGRTYRVQRFDYALFALRPGRLTIEPAAVRITVPDRVEWWRSGGVRTLATEPLAIDVEALPPGAPEGFSGSVGRYSMEGRLESETATLGVPVELAVTVRGQGNPSAIGAPALPSWPDVDVGPPVVDTDLEIAGQTVRGEATFRYLLAPRSEGPLDLGTAVFAYFDPDTEAYVTESLRLGEISVRPAMARLEGSERENGPTLWSADDPARPRPWGLGRRPAYWIAVGAPWVLWLAGAGLMRVRRGRRREDPRIDALDALRALATPGDEGIDPTGTLRALDAVRCAWGDRWPADADRVEAWARAELGAMAYGRRERTESKAIAELIGRLERSVDA